MRPAGMNSSAGSRCIKALVSVAIMAALTSCSDANPQPPSPSPTTANEASDVARCLLERGWEVKVEADGVTADVPPEQQERLNADMEECIEQFGDSPPAFPQTAAAAEQQYDMLLAVAECVSGLGYPVDDPPSRQAYVEAMLNEQLPHWHPYQHLYEDGYPLTEVGQVRAQCPVTT